MIQGIKNDDCSDLSGGAQHPVTVLRRPERSGDSGVRPFLIEGNDLKDFIISVVGADIRSMADQLTEKLGSESVDGTVGLDVRA